MSRVASAAIAVCLLSVTLSRLAAQDASAADGVASTNVAAVQTTYTPMTESERLSRYLKDTVNPLSLVSSAAAAGIGQWKDCPAEWKQGGEGYGRR